MLESVWNYIFLIMYIVYTINYNTFNPFKSTIGFISKLKIVISVMEYKKLCRSLVSRKFSKF